MQIEKLDGTNYDTWKVLMKSVLIQHELWKVTSGITKKTNDNAQVFEKADEKALALLMLNVKASQLMHIKNCDTANSAWKKLETAYIQIGPARKVTLFKKLVYAKAVDGQSLKEHVDMFTDVIGKLTEMDIKIQDEVTSIILLCSLPSSYENFVIAIESRDTLPTLEALKLKIVEEEQRRTSHQDGTNNDGAFYSSGKKKKGDKKNRDFKCYKCGKAGHKSYQCNKNKFHSNTGSSENGQKVNKSTANKETAKNAFIAFTAKEDTKCWYLDSGASSHMTPHDDILRNVRNTDVNHVIAANDSKMTVKKAGDAEVNFDGNEIEIKNVLHVPDLMVNLLSISKITQQGNKIIFDDEGASIFNKKNECLLNCKPQNGIYKLNEIETSFISKAEDTALTWHRRLGHTNYRTLCEMRGAKIGIQFRDDDSEITNCRICCEAKQHREPFKRSESNTKATLEIIHSDLVGPMENLSLGKAKYLLTFVDDFSRKIFPYFIHSKNEVFNKFLEFKSWAENQTGNKIKILRTDNGTEYIAKEFGNHLKKCGIQHQLTNVYTPQQNGVAERYNRTIIEKAKCLLFDAELPKAYWAEATNMSAYLINKSISSVHKRIPDELFYNSKIDLSGLKIFGSTVMVHTPREKRRKWDKKSKMMIFVGYDKNTKGYRCIDRTNGKLTISRDVKFQESPNPKFISIIETETNDEVRAETEAPCIDISSDEASDIENGENQKIENTVVEQEDPKDLTYNPGTVVTTTPNTQRASRSKTKVLGTSLLFGNLAEISSTHNLSDPKSVQEISERDDSKHWKLAMQEEMQAHATNKTWTLTELPPGKKPIKAKWVFKTKCDENGNISRYKARLVAKGYSQQFGIDYNETYSPVVRYTSIRYLIALAAKADLKIYQMDVTTAFLQGELNEEIYMEQPEEFNDGTKMVCKLEKSLYGLKQAGRMWNIKLDAALKQYGLEKCKTDPCIYYRGNLKLVIAIYVDDFLIFYKKEDELKELKAFLNKTFQMKDIGMAKHCIGIRISQEKNNIDLDQSVYIQNVLRRFGMENCKPVGTPCDTNQKLKITDVNEENSLVGKVPYQEAVGCLLFLAQATRPDIAFAVNNVSRFNNNHAQIHWQAVKRIMRYLSATIAMKLRYMKGHTSNIQAYCDADWASDVDQRKSCSGFVIKMGSAAISWGSKKQTIVALSSTEAEYIALSTITREILWLKQLQVEIDQNAEALTKIYCDNQSAIKLAEIDAYRPRTKHIDIRFHHIRENIESKIIAVEFIPTHEMVADSLTKPVTKEKSFYCADQMGLKV